MRMLMRTLSDVTPPTRLIHPRAGLARRGSNFLSHGPARHCDLCTAVNVAAVPPPAPANRTHRTPPAHTSPPPPARICPAGLHVIAIHAHSCGAHTRILLSTAPVVACSVSCVTGPTAPLSTTWTCANLAGSYSSQWQRMSPLLVRAVAVMRGDAL